MLWSSSDDICMIVAEARREAAGKRDGLQHTADLIISVMLASREHGQNLT